jgi:hypothetical protein
MKIRLMISGVAIAVAIVAIGVSTRPAEKVHAAPFGYGGTTVSAPVLGAGNVITWTYTIVSTNTFGFPFTAAMSGGQAGAAFTTVTPPGMCVPMGSATTVCTLPQAGAATIVLTASVTIPAQCTAQTFTRPALTLTGWPGSLGVAEPPIAAVAALAFANFVPANTTLCPATPVPNTPIPNTPVPPPPVFMIPQVFQHVPQGIFNGSRNNTPTPVRPREVGTAGSTGVGLPPSGVMPALRPPSTGDAGMPTLRMLRLNAW